MSISLIRKADVVARVPERWVKQYEGYQDRGDQYDKAPKSAALLALKPGFTAEQVNEIIGNTSWTENECDECGADVPVLVRVGQEPDYETRWLDLCPACVARVAAAIDGEQS